MKEVLSSHSTLVSMKPLRNDCEYSTLFFVDFSFSRANEEKTMSWGPYPSNAIAISMAYDVLYEMVKEKARYICGFEPTLLRMDISERCFNFQENSSLWHHIRIISSQETNI